MKRFVPLTRKINLIIICSLVVGVGIVIAYFAYSQNLSLRETRQGHLRQQSDILFQSIKNAMLPGEAPIAVQLFEDIRLADPAYKIFLLRETGVQAFSDNSTVEAVNANLGYQAFSPKEVFPQNLMVMEDDQNFNRSVREHGSRGYQYHIGHHSGGQSAAEQCTHRFRILRCRGVDPYPPSLSVFARHIDPACKTHRRRLCHRHQRRFQLPRCCTKP
jgi:hypothetical protein